MVGDRGGGDDESCDCDGREIHSKLEKSIELLAGSLVVKLGGPRCEQQNAAAD